MILSLNLSSHPPWGGRGVGRFEATKKRTLRRALLLSPHSPPSQKAEGAVAGIERGASVRGEGRGLAFLQPVWRLTARARLPFPGSGREGPVLE